MNHCDLCHITQGDYFIHDDPSKAIYRHLFYQDTEPCKYYSIKSDCLIPITAAMPVYADQMSEEEIICDIQAHLRNPKRENIVSMQVTQSKINQLLSKSIKGDDIELFVKDFEEKEEK